MKHVPRHVKGVGPAARDAARDALRRSGISVGAAFTMIRKDVQELRRHTARPHLDPDVFEQRFHELAAQIGALQGVARSGGAGPVSDDFFNHVKTLLAQNLALLQQQVATAAADAITGPAESIRRDVASLKEIQASVDRRTQDTFEAVYGTIERIVDRLAAIEQELRDRQTNPPIPSAALLRDPAPAGPSPSDQTPVDDDPAWAGLPAIQSPPAPEAVSSDESWQMLRRPAVFPDEEAGPDPGQESMTAGPPAFEEFAQPAARSKGLRGKLAILGAGAALLTVVAIALALDFYAVPGDATGEPTPVAGAEEASGQQARTAEPPGDAQPVLQEASNEARNDVISDAGPASGGIDSTPRSDGAASAAAAPGASAAAASVPAPADPVVPTVQSADSLLPNVVLPAPADRDPWPKSQSPVLPDAASASLPPAIGGRALIAAAQAGDPGAAYEIGIRFAHSRNAPPDLVRAAAWLEKAANGGIVPAQFRLGSMYEKGAGVRKDPGEARRLYMAAAAKGHAKAMHNLAVLYANGIDGAPDYRAAAEWFHKAAAYGAVDSQYNLGILYARGSGVRRDLVESYKWFALAAKSGDRDAAHKRDDVARGLAPKQLEAARASVEAFSALPQPDEATSVKAPPGGWDQMVVLPRQQNPGRWSFQNVSQEGSSR